MQPIQGQTRLAPNEFKHFAQEYFDRCKKGFEPLDTIAAKWNFEDLIPGLSDFDARLLVGDGVGPEGMVQCDYVVGQVHLELCRKFPRWSRILEHTPGICITWSELSDPRLYQPETRFWSFHLGRGDEFARLEEYMSSLSWQPVDEYFFLKKFSTYFSPYQHGIDPPVNLGIFEPEYAWHSRAMHYFTPAAQAALAVLDRKVTRGKLDTLRRWKELLPGQSVFGEIMDMASSQYARLDLHDQKALARFEDSLFEVLCRIKQMVFDSARIVSLRPADDIQVLKDKLRDFPADPLLDIFNGIRFCRIRKSRYLFYFEAPEYFATDWLIVGEFTKWFRQVLIKAILRSYGRLKCGKSDAGLEEIIEALYPEIIDKRQARIMRQIYELCFEQYQPGSERRVLEQVVPLCADYYLILEKILADAKKIAPAPCSPSAK